MIIKDYKELIIKRLEQLMGFYASYDTPSILMRLCKKYPHHKTKLWLIWQIKEITYYFVFYGVLVFVSTACNPSIICYDCLQIVNNTYNISAMSNYSIIENFTSNFFDNVTVIL